MGDSLLGLGTRPFRRGPVRVDMGLPRPVPLQPVIDDVREGVLAREIKVEGLGAPRRAEDAPYTAGADEAAAPNPSAQWPLAVLAAAHLSAACWDATTMPKVGLLVLSHEIGASPSPSQHLGTLLQAALIS